MPEGNAVGFLSLPRELRDQVYSYLFPSNLLVVPYPKRSSDARAESIHFGLYLYDETANAFNPTLRAGDHSTNISLSILRVNRLTHLETKALFWSQATFAFRQQQDVIDTLKGMNQIASRMIQRVTLDVSLAKMRGKPFAKAINMLASRARLGELNSIMLTISPMDFGDIIRRREDIHMFHLTDRWRNYGYDELLSFLREVSYNQNWQCERSIQVTGVSDWEDIKQKSKRLGKALKYMWMRWAAQEMHYVWGGKFFLGDRLIWDNYEPIEPPEHQGRPPPPPPIRVPAPPRTC
ncbi:hypothetical protein ACMFMF_001534 [Clarireedia jacksonii]